MIISGFLRKINHNQASELQVDQLYPVKVFFQRTRLKASKNKFPHKVSLDIWIAVLATQPKCFLHNSKKFVLIKFLSEKFFWSSRMQFWHVWRLFAGTWKALLAISEKFFSTVFLTLLVILFLPKVWIFLTMFFKFEESFQKKFLKLFIWTCRTQFWQTCLNIFDEKRKIH